MIALNQRTVGRLRSIHRPGLSLLEVLVSLAIFLFSLVAIASLVDFGSERAKAAAMQTAGVRLAQSKLAEVEAGVISASTSDNGMFEDEPEWNYSVEPGAATVPNVYPVTVRVWREVSGRRYEVVLTQMIYDPAEMGKAAAATPPTATTSTTGSGQ